MARLTFSGGIHPYDGKDLSKDKPIKEVLPKGDLIYPLSQHIGAPAQPIVKKGDKVLTGQKIAEAGGFGASGAHYYDSQFLFILNKKSSYSFTILIVYKYFLQLISFL